MSKKKDCNECKDDKCTEIPEKCADIVQKMSDIQIDEFCDFISSFSKMILKQVKYDN